MTGEERAIAALEAIYDCGRISDSCRAVYMAAIAELALKDLGITRILEGKTSLLYQTYGKTIL